MWTYGTDAPLYHWPITTICLITVNVLTFFHTLIHPEVFEHLVLHYGQGLRPLEWITSNFVHADLLHLLGNMLGLWTFGLIVEGKIGWWKVLGITLGIGIVQSAVEQLLALGMTEGSSCGASAIVFGLMAMSLVWAPKNDVHCFILFWYRVWFFDVPVLVFCGVFILLEVVLAIVGGLHWGSEVLHLMGVVAGAVLAVVLLKTGAVDCENWDIFSVLKGKHLKRVELGSWEESNADHAAKRGRIVRSTPQHELALEEFRQFIAGGQALFAFQAHQRLSGKHADWILSQDDLRFMIDGLLQGQNWLEAIAAMQQFIAQFPGQANEMRIQLAFVLLAKTNQPREARQVLRPVHASLVPASQRETLLQLRAAIESRLGQPE